MTATGRYVGRHRPNTVQPVTAGYSPLDPATRSALAPHHWADRQLPAGVDERTGLMPRITDAAADVQRWIADGCPTDDQTKNNIPEEAA